MGQMKLDDSTLGSSHESNHCATTTYVNKIGGTTFIISNSFTGTKSLDDVFEELVVSAFRQKHIMQ
jgi:hypothetical protein